MLRHTEAEIETVGKFDLVEGNTYIIQHKKEGLKSINPMDKNITPAEINNYITRFRGKFVKYDIGKSSRYPDGIPGITPSREVAVFENVEIISKNKRDLTDDIYVIFTDPREGRQHITKGVSWVDISVDDITANRSNQTKYEKAVRTLLLGIRSNYKVAFAVNAWTFAPDSKELENKMVTNILGHAAYDVGTADTETEQNLANLQRKIFGSDLGKVIAEFAGYQMPDPTAEQLEQLRNRSTLSGHKRTLEKVEGGRKRRTRRNKRGKTRKGKSRKSRTMKHRRHYRK